MPWAWRHHRQRTWPTIACGLVIVIALAAMTPLVANMLSRPLERALAEPAGCRSEPPSTAVVLGGGIDGRPRSAMDYTALNLASRRRIDRAVDWWGEGEGRRLVLQGGTGNPPLAELMAAYAGMRGVSASALQLEKGSFDTWSNARQAAQLTPRLPRRIVLVTSWIHMARAQEAFTSAGFEVCPLGTDLRRLPSRLPWALVPRTSGLANSEVALHEWVGLVNYRWRGRHGIERTAVVGETGQ